MAYAAGNYDLAAVEVCLAKLRRAFGEQAVQEMLAEGRRLSLAEAVAVAAMIADPGAPGDRDGRPTEALTRRDRDILRLLAVQKTDREIAETLFLSRRTVNWHVRSVLLKLKTGATSRSDAVARARASEAL